jgi:hypothetical protein
MKMWIIPSFLELTTMFLFPSAHSHGPDWDADLIREYMIGAVTNTGTYELIGRKLLQGNAVFVPESLL